MITSNFTLRINFTHEDKAAKGLRSLREPQQAPEIAVYFTVREAVEMFPRLLLLGERGSGKTFVSQQLIAEVGGTYVDAGNNILTACASESGLLIIDGVDRLSPTRFAELLSEIGDRPVVMLGDGAVVKSWPIPSNIAVHSLMPLDLAERTDFVADYAPDARAALSPAAANPALFVLALSMSEQAVMAEDLIDIWLADSPEMAEAGFDAISDNSSVNRAVDGLLAAQHLTTLEIEDVAELYRNAPERWAPSLASMLRRAPESAAALTPLLTSSESDTALRGALLIAEVTPDHEAIVQRLLTLIETGRLSPFDRDQAARILSKQGDPRDLEALCPVDGGRFIMGSTNHPNSQPVHEADVASFRIGRYPVTNKLYGRFVEATQRKWVSPEAGVAERRNAPATDLTWHDARAFCDWLTAHWRSKGKIGHDEIVRLPTEPEWERAARGDMPDGGDDVVYPWGKGWNTGAANSEETGFNAQCAVGLFPAGASPFGVLDMAGQIWEWTTTLWGDDMATPSFKYPYADDGREDPSAGPTIRRVLRGGCFSSTSLKACCTYRGSLEPEGFWRGNGFRIVVAKAS